ncbi:hypothetical protein GQ457_04G024270 [Hibiscus cannabinus]
MVAEGMLLLSVVENRSKHLDCYYYYFSPCDAALVLHCQHFSTLKILANAVADWLARDIQDKGCGQNFFMDPCLAVPDIMNHDLQHSLQVSDTGIGVTVWLPYVLFFLHQLREVF